MSHAISTDPARDMGEVIRYLRPTPSSSKYPTAKGEKTGPWRKSEDYILEHWVEKKGPADWVGAALLIPGRTSKQCRERWHQNLNPALNHDPICEDEGKIIVEMVQQKGKKWAEIAREMRNNRSDNAIKNYWNGWNNCRKRQQKSVHSGASSSSSQPYLQYNQSTGLARPNQPLPSYACGRNTSYQQTQHHRLSDQSYHAMPHEPSLQPQYPYNSHQIHGHPQQASMQRHHQRTPSQSVQGRPPVAIIASPASSTPSTEVGSNRIASCSPIERTFGEFTPSPRSSVTEPTSFTTSRRSSLGLGRTWQGSPALQSVPRTPQTDIWQHRLAAPTNSGSVMIGSPQWHHRGTGNQTQIQNQPVHEPIPVAPVLDPRAGTSQRPASSQINESLMFHSHQMPRTQSPSRRKQEDLEANGATEGDSDAKRRKISVAAICN